MASPRGHGIRRVLRVAAVGLAGVVAAVVLLFLALTGTPWGREQVREIVLRALHGPVNGTVRLGNIGGDLLHGVVLTDVAITDSTGQPFVSVRRVEAQYELADLWHRRIALRHVRLDHPVVVLVESPDGVWNFDRIFRHSTSPSPVTTPPGWGSWISATDVHLFDGDLTVRSPWQPDTSLSGAARDSAIRVALAPPPDFRVLVTATAGGGYEKTIAAHAITATLPALRITDPDDPVKVARVASLSTDLAAFRPPHATVRDVVGTFHFTGDSLWFSQARVALPGSLVSGDGAYTFATGDLRLQLAAAPAALGDLRFLHPSLPTTGSGTAVADITWRGRSQTYSATHVDLRSGATRVWGRLGLTIGDSVIFHDTDLQFEALDTRLVEQVWPAAHLPRQGIGTGRAQLTGPMTALASDVDLTFDDRSAGRSHVQASGVVGLVGVLRAQHVSLSFDPLQVALLRGAAPSWPVGGTITGRATLDGSTADSLSTTADLTHRQGDSYTHMVATGDVAFAPSPGGSPARPPAGATLDRPAPTGVAPERTATSAARPSSPAAALRDRTRHVDLSADFDTVDLGLVTKFIPAARLSGRSSATVRLNGSLHDLAVHTQVAGTGAADSAGLTLDGHLDVASNPLGYDLTAAAHRFDLHGVAPHLPPTAITAVVTARGRGTNPGTMDAVVAADLAPSVVDSLGVDTIHVRGRIGGGQLTVDTAHLRGLATTADVQGTIGLVDHHDGELRYRIQVDSLLALRRFLPPDTSSVVPRPGRVAEAIREARVDSARMAAATDVERAALGEPPPPLVVDSPATIRRDVLAGRALATGTVRGTTDRFDLHGDLVADSIIALGNSTRRMSAEYDWKGGPSLKAPASAVVHVDSATLAGFALDSLDARVQYRSPDGSVRLFVRQSGGGNYVLAAHVVYSPAVKEVRYDTLVFRFDSTVWRASRPGSVRWGADGLTIHDVRLANGRVGRIEIEGTVPTKSTADANLRVMVRDFELGDLATLAETDLPVRGLLSVQGEVTGTAHEPRLRGHASLSTASIHALPLPSAYVTFVYDTMAVVSHSRILASGGTIHAVCGRPGVSPRQPLLRCHGLAPPRPSAGRRDPSRQSAVGRGAAIHTGGAECERPGERQRDDRRHGPEARPSGRPDGGEWIDDHRDHGNRPPRDRGPRPTHPRLGDHRLARGAHAGDRRSPPLHRNC